MSYWFLRKRWITLLIFFQIVGAGSGCQNTRALFEIRPILSEELRPVGWKRLKAIASFWELVITSRDTQITNAWVFDVAQNSLPVVVLPASREKQWFVVLKMWEQREASRRLLLVGEVALHGNSPREVPIELRWFGQECEDE